MNDICNLKSLKNTLAELKNPDKAKLAERFFKTGKGEYGYGDKFLGIIVPDLRKLSRLYKKLELDDVTVLLQSKWHEERLLALFILVLQYNASNKDIKEQIYNLYIKNYQYINNWDLVDSSAHYIVGAHLIDKNKSLLKDWVKSDDLWQRRISIIATFDFIKNNIYSETLSLAKILLQDKEDLIHKAVGWMLREVGKKDITTLKKFLDIHYKKMPRTMLRYSIEKFPENRRKEYLLGKA